MSKRVALAVGIAAFAAAQASDAALSERRVPNAHAVKACAAAGPFWPTMTLALDGGTAWVACKEQSRLIRIDLTHGRATASVRLNGAPIAVAAGLGAVWALDSGGTLYRLDHGRVTRRIDVPAAAAYNVWTGGGSLWVADDQGAAVLRISPSTKKVTRVAVSDGPADMAFDASHAWVIDHRDRALYRIDLATNKPTRLAVLGDDNTAPERIAYLGGSLWVTGRGAPLYEVNPETGATKRSLGLGGSGIDVVASGGALWVPVRSWAIDRSGLPTMTAVRRVARNGRVETVAKARERVDVHGLATAGGEVWLADNTDGYLYRLPRG